MFGMSTRELYPWKQEYSMGIAQIDKQHKQLFDAVNELHEAMTKGHGKEQIQATLDRLISYAVTHFTDEEAEMRRAGYTKLSQHQAEHKALTDKVSYYRQTLRAGNLAITLEAMRFLGQWLRSHILHEDMDFARFCEAKSGAKMAVAGRR